MSDLHDAADDGDPDQLDISMAELRDAAEVGDLDRVKLLVEQGMGMETGNLFDQTPLVAAIMNRHLEQGVEKHKFDFFDMTPLHVATHEGPLEIIKLLMAYGADLNAVNDNGQLPMNTALTEEIRQAICNEPQRRRDLQPRKRCVEQDQHPDADATAPTQQDDEEEGDEEQSNSKQLAEGKAEVGGEVAGEDQDSEPSSDEDGK